MRVLLALCALVLLAATAALANGPITPLPMPEGAAEGDHPVSHLKELLSDTLAKAEAASGAKKVKLEKEVKVIEAALAKAEVHGEEEEEEKKPESEAEHLLEDVRAAEASASGEQKHHLEEEEAAILHDHLAAAAAVAAEEHSSCPCQATHTVATPCGCASASASPKNTPNGLASGDQLSGHVCGEAEVCGGVHFDKLLAALEASLVHGKAAPHDDLLAKAEEIAAEEDKKDHDKVDEEALHKGEEMAEGHIAKEGEIGHASDSELGALLKKMESKLETDKGAQAENDAEEVGLLAAKIEHDKKIESVEAEAKGKLAGLLGEQGEEHKKAEAAEKKMEVAELEQELEAAAHHHGEHHNEHEHDPKAAEAEIEKEEDAMLREIEGEEEGEVSKEDDIERLVGEEQEKLKAEMEGEMTAEPTGSDGRHEQVKKKLTEMLQELAQQHSGNANAVSAVGCHNGNGCGKFIEPAISVHGKEVLPPRELSDKLTMRGLTGDKADAELGKLAGVVVSESGGAEGGLESGMVAKLLELLKGHGHEHHEEGEGLHNEDDLSLDAKEEVEQAERAAKKEVEDAKLHKDAELASIDKEEDEMLKDIVGVDV